MFAAEGQQSWATCPLTQNGVLRIVGQPRYPNSPGSPAAVVAVLKGMTGLPDHVFWPDDVSLLDEQLLDASRLLSSAQVTDSYLLGLARSKGGRSATFDRRLVADAVRGGPEALCLIG